MQVDLNSLAAVIGIVSGVSAAVAAVVVTRTDVGWLKRQVKSLWDALQYERQRIDAIFKAKE